MEAISTSGPDGSTAPTLPGLEPRDQLLPLWTDWVPGKILLSGEYLVLDGAMALGFPTRFGQEMKVFEGDAAGILDWVAVDSQGVVWLAARFRAVGGSLSLAENEAASTETNRLQKWLQTAWNLCEDKAWRDTLSRQGLRVQTRLDFPRHWGLGSSSTLIALLVRWLKVEPWALYRRVQTGSGYDLAIALEGRALVFRMEGFDENGNPLPNSGEVEADPGQSYTGQSYTGQSYPGPTYSGVETTMPDGAGWWLIDPGTKQNSEREVFSYRLIDPALRRSVVPELTRITLKMAQNPGADEWLALLEAHDLLLEKVLGRPCVHRSLGAGFPGRLKSLGAWGGDLMLAVSTVPDAALKWLQDRPDWVVLDFHAVVAVQAEPVARPGQAVQDEQAGQAEPVARPGQADPS